MSMKILVVDDDPCNRKLLDTLLRNDDYAVRCVESGAASLAAVAVERPDAILLDLMMPGMDGFRSGTTSESRSCNPKHPGDHDYGA